MTLYETTFLLTPQVDDSTLDRQVRDVTDLIASNGGNIVNENRMGTRRLAYEIQGLTQAFYASLLFEAEPAVLSLLDRHYRLNEPYLRFLTVVFEGDPQKVIEDSRPIDLGEEMQEMPPKERPVDGGRRGGRRMEHSAGVEPVAPARPESTPFEEPVPDDRLSRTDEAPKPEEESPDDDETAYGEDEQL